MKVTRYEIKFNGRILLLGCGAVSRCLQPLLLRHIDMDFSKLTIMDFEDKQKNLSNIISKGAKFVQQRINPENIYSVLSQYLSSGDLLIDLAWDIDTLSLIQWCHDNNVLYINTSVELWDPYKIAPDSSPTDKTLYVRHMRLRNAIKKWNHTGPTAVVEHGANPGLVSHWVKKALVDITNSILKNSQETQKIDKLSNSLLNKLISENNFAQLSYELGVKVIHISERDSQITDIPKQVNEFVNTWSIEGFREEGIAPAEMGWGTHERTFPKWANTHSFGPQNQICLSQMGINTWVRSWVPSGDIIGMVVRHGEAFTISDHLTVWQDDKPIYRPTVHYAYLPTDSAIASLHELKMKNYNLQSKRRIISSEIINGKDEVGVLLLGHELNGWWTGSQLDIHETRKLVNDPDLSSNSTTLQVAASMLGALFWMIKNPNKGFCVPDNLPYKEILDVANLYLGPCPSIPTDWNPLKKRIELFGKYGKQIPNKEDMWQFSSFLID